MFSSRIFNLFRVSNGCQQFKRFSHLKISDENGIRLITMTDEKTRNSMTLQMTNDLIYAVNEKYTDTNIRAIVIASSSAVFSSGHNLKEIATSEGRQVFHEYSELMMAIQQCPVPVITAVDGPAAAAGVQLVAQSDICIATSRASFSTPGANYGVFCSTPGIPLARNVPRKVAAYMLFTGTPITADQALQSGLVSKVVPPTDLDKEINEVCEAIKAKSRIIIELGKKFYYKQIEMDVRTAYQKGAKVMSKSLQLVDGIEGVRSFAEKRPPVWKHILHL